jgi:hypothetical protein
MFLKTNLLLQVEGLLHSAVLLLQGKIHYPKREGNNLFLGRKENAKV